MSNPYDPPSGSADAELAGRANARWSAAAIVVVGILLPGWPSYQMRRSLLGGALLLSIPVAFVVFGPVWDVLLFPTPPLNEFGFYPFLAICISAPLFSVWLGFVDRERQPK